MEETLSRKARFILGGDVLIPKDLRMPFRLSRSTAGPGAGKRSAVFAFEGTRVKKGVSSDSGEFELRADGDAFRITRNGEPFIDRVEIVPVAFHCPGQAFFNLDQRCMYRCAFCTSPLLGPDATKDLTEDKVVDMIRSEEAERGIPSVALTSGVVGSVQETVERMAGFVSRLRREFPEKTIGVEPYVECEEQIRLLRDAGADEIKLNVESPDPGIFGKVCPDLDHGLIHRMIVHAVDIFGRGRVSSNVIYGMGETDDDVLREMEVLSSAGCIPVLRALKVGGSNRGNLEDALGTVEAVTPERMIRLARMHKTVLERHGLHTGMFRTMCFECRCCDLVPFKDL